MTRSRGWFNSSAQREPSDDYPASTAASPERAKGNRPGRKLWVAARHKAGGPKGRKTVLAARLVLSPLPGLGRIIRSATQGLRPGLFSPAAPRLENLPTQQL